jgi:predicted metal-dependent hydrolase
MAEIDIETTISDIKIFIEKLKSDLPEVFTPDGREGPMPESGKVLYQGELLEAEVILNKDAGTNFAALKDGRIFVYVKSEHEDVSAAVDGWLRERAKEILPLRVKEWAEKLGVEYNNVTIKDQKTMWASCSQKNNLNFSYRIIKMPKVIIDYLIIHELVHLIHFNHGADYWATVSLYSPGHKEHRKWLNNNRYAVLAGSDVKYASAQGGPAQERAPQRGVAGQTEAAETAPEGGACALQDIKETDA